MEYYLGVDLGTSSVKIIAANSEGAIVGSTSGSFSIISEQANYSEEDPRDWLSAFETAFQELLRRFPVLKTNLKSISFAGQMHSLVLLNQTGTPLRNAILWNDTRTTQEVKQLMENYRNHLLKVEKNRALEGFTLPKILWIKAHEPQIWQQTWKFMLPKDYLVYYLTGNVFTDRSDASGTILYDLEQHEWDMELLKELAIEPEKCPAVLRSTDSAGELTAEIKARFGIQSPVEVIMGGADNACGALGNITDRKTQGLISIGTSGVVLTYAAKKTQPNGTYHYFNSALTDLDYKMGVTLAAGYSLEWFKKVFAPTESFAELTQLAVSSPIGSNGILFFPYLFGERSPYFNAELTGGFSGFKAYHNRADLVRAVLEGIAFSLRNVYDHLGAEETRSLERFRITGGVVKNEFWLQLFADVFNKEIEVLALDEGPAFGALICGITGVTGEDPAKIWQRYNRVKKVYVPSLDNHQNYQLNFERFVEQSQQWNQQNTQ
ncbi:xylulokinase [Enterococcus sp. CSURQ0835]|uniref:xylulokinase n=1 Tax=Enterococcus sp. CSURQ0835 TaxID=2681394 RepID=UPI00135C2E42|nr:xylulokinase [Enterococcus sp. CSURQ0835]